MSLPNKILVLLIEDDLGDAQLVQIALRQSSQVQFVVTWVDSIAKAQAQLSGTVFDVALLDLSLPDSVGLATLLKLKQLSPRLPIITLTGHSDIEFALAALENGSADYLVKGDFSPDSLSRTIRYALQRNELDARNRLMVAALEAAANGIIITDYKGKIEWANSSFCHLTGYETAEILGKRPGDLVNSGKQNAAFYEQMWEVISKGETWRGGIINKRKSGDLYHEELSISPVRDEYGKVTHFIGIKEDISERKQLESILQELAHTDSLTGLYNRRVFVERLEQETARLARSDTSPISLLMLDLDHFKRINDNFGHAMGDSVLRHFAKLMKETIRSIDLAARLGGEEFAILLPGADKNEAIGIAERICRQTASSALPCRTDPLHYTVSIGVAQVSVHDRNTEAALHRADSALYSAKANGRNQVCWFEP